MAGRAVFLGKGFVAASIEEIARLAGYARGTFYSNFSNKIEMPLELLKRDCDEIDAEGRFLRRASPATIFKGRRSRTIGNTSAGTNRCRGGWKRNFHDAQFHEHFDAFLRDEQIRMVAYVASLADRTGALLPIPVEMPLDGLMGLWDGVPSLLPR